MPATGRTSDSREFENGEPAARPFRDSTGPALPYVPALDGLRAVAIVLVMGFHFGIDLHGTDAFSRAFRHLRIGFMGVDIFFVLSGTLITLLIARSAGTVASTSSASTNAARCDCFPERLRS